jgi:hypothetical protein
LAKPTKENTSGVESFDHGAVARLPEYHEASKALDALVHAFNRAELEGTQADWLKTVEQMAASLSYSDSSGHKDDGCVGAGEGVWPYKVVLDDRGYLESSYRCPHCGQEWTCGYAVNIGYFV